jgi:putative PIN family toxin of toxin-antitoxin system
VLRAVLDANVLASAFIRPLGPSGRILSALVDRSAFQLVLSTAILDELRRVLFYPRLRKELPGSDVDILLRVTALAILADLAEGDLVVKAVKDDPDDDKYLAAALLGRAEVLVSGDHHLLDLKEYQGVRILTPKVFVGLL